MQSDIIIVGGGMAGLSLACAAASNGNSVIIIESSDPAIFQDKIFDGRVSAISYSSRKIFESFGVWEEMSHNAGAINDIRVVDEDSPLFLHYDHELVSDEPMGHIIENRFIRMALMNKLKQLSNIILLAPVKYTNIEYGNHFAKVLLSDEREIKAKLIIAADGKESAVREQAGIKTFDADYKQTGIVCTVKHEKHHQNTAIEKFLPAGPFAILPMADGYHSSLVWTEKSELVPIYMKMAEREFNQQVRLRFGDWLGETEVTGPRWSYPLSLKFARQYYAKRLCLVGDAAHAIHPIAGQGFNLGIRDIATIAELIKETSALGLDIGGDTVLQRYEKIRRIDNIQLITVTDILNRLFSNNIAPVKLARKLGLAAVEKLPSLKKIFIKHAMGV